MRRALLFAALLEWRNSEGYGPVNEGRATFHVQLPIELIEEFLVNSHFEYRKGVIECFKVGESTEEMRVIYKAVRLHWPFTNRDTLMEEHTGDAAIAKGGRMIGESFKGLSGMEHIVVYSQVLSTSLCRSFEVRKR